MVFFFLSLLLVALDVHTIIVFPLTSVFNQDSMIDFHAQQQRQQPKREERITNPLLYFTSNLHFHRPENDSYFNEREQIIRTYQQYFVLFSFYLDTVWVSVKCVVNVFYSAKNIRRIQIANEYEKSAWLEEWSFRAREGSVRERKNDQISMGKLLTYSKMILQECWCEFTRVWNDLHMKTIKSHKTCKTSELLSRAKTWAKIF